MTEPAKTTAVDDARKPSRRQIVFNWIMGEDLADHDGYWSGSDGVKAVDELLAALDATEESKIAELEAQLRQAAEHEKDLLHALEVNGRNLLEHSDAVNELQAQLRQEREARAQLTMLVGEIQEQARLREIDYWNVASAANEDREPECTCTKLDVDLLDARGCERHG